MRHVNPHRKFHDKCASNENLVNRMRPNDGKNDGKNDEKGRKITLN